MRGQREFLKDKNFKIRYQNYCTVSIKLTFKKAKKYILPLTLQTIFYDYEMIVLSQTIYR